MADLHPIEKQPPCQSVINVLKDALEQAERGELQSVVIMKAWWDGKTSNSWGFGKVSHSHAMLAEVTLLQHDLTFCILSDDKHSALYRRIWGSK